MSSVTSIRLKPEIETPLNELAKKRDRSKSYLINEAVREYLARESQAEQRWQETLEALDSVKQGKGIPEESVNDWLDSWGTDNELEPPTS